MLIKAENAKDELRNLIEKISKDKKDTNPALKTDSNNYYQSLKEKIPYFESELDTIIQKIIEIIKEYNLKQLLDILGFKYSFTSPEALKNNTNEIKVFKLDYMLSLITSIEIESIGEKDCDESIVNQIEELLDKLTYQSMFYLMLSTDVDNEPSELKFRQSMQYMIVKGDSYSNHKIELCKEMFVKYDDIFNREFGITSVELIQRLIDLANQPFVNLNAKKEYFQILQKSHSEFLEKLSQTPKIEQMEFFENFKDSESVAHTNRELQKVYDKYNSYWDDFIFKLTKINLPVKVLDKLTLELGDNKAFQKGKIDYFPNNNTLIYEKPILKLGDEFFCFNPTIIFYNLQSILENILLDIIPSDKHQKIYYKKKGEYLEEKSLELFRKLLPNSQIYSNLQYGKNDEVDGLVIFDNNLLIVESKSNKFTLGARQGNIEKIKTDTKNIVEKAYQQAIRAKKYIFSEDKVEFRNNKKQVVLSLCRKDINEIYLINTTLDPLYHISTNLSSLKEFGFIQDDEWIWSVYLNDLRIISEILDSPSEFLLYLERRIKYNDYYQIKISEEIDIFGYFLGSGLYFDDIDFPKDNFMLALDSSFSEKIDLFYYSQEGSLEETYSKPCLFENSINLKDIVKQVEEKSKKNFTNITKFLLSLDGSMQKLFHENIELMKIYKRNDIHTCFSEVNKGITFISERNFDETKAKKQCQIYAYERKINIWYLIVIGENGVIDYYEFYFDNSYNEILENDVKKIRNYRMAQRIEIDKKIGRNELCPCGSGKKYKKCCLK